MRQKLLLLFCFSFLLFVSETFAQEKLITGTVKTETGEPIPSASVKIMGTTKGTITDTEGAFKIGVTSSSVLQVSALNYIPKEVRVGDQTLIQIVLEPGDESELSDVVVTALGIKRSKSNLPYAVQEVKGDEFTETRQSNFTNALTGQVAGLQIRQNNNLGGSTNVILRGFKSLNGNNQALFVIDGVPIDNGNTNSTNQQNGFKGFDYGNAAADINPDDIASVTVLKGAAATALYGSRAANGVILINTKKPSKPGIGVAINFGVTTGSMDKSTFPDYQDKYGAGYFDPDIKATHNSDGDHPEFLYRDLDGDGKPDYIVKTGDDASYGAAFDPNLNVMQWTAGDPTSPYFNKATPWVAAKNGPASFFINPWSNSSNVVVSGSNDRGTFKLGYTRNQDKGIMVNSNLVKDLMNFGASYKLLDNLTADASIDYSRVRGRGRYGNGYGDPSSIAANFRQWWQTNVDIKDLENAYFRNGESNVGWNMKSLGQNNAPAYWDNPYFSRYKNYETDERNRYIGHISLNYQALDWLNIMARVSLDHYDEIQEERTATGSLNPDGYTRYNHTFSEFNYDLLATVDKDLNEDFKLNALLGGNIRRTKGSSIFVETNGGLVIPDWYAISNSKNPIEAPIETAPNIQVNGLFAGATLTYRNMLSLDLSGRNDVSSTLPKENNSFYYGSVSGSFIFSELLKDATWLNHGKLRVNYASVGNSAPFASLTDVYDKPTPYGSIPMFSLPNTKNNPDLKPERTNSFEVGLNMQMLQNRVGFDVTYYKTNSIDQIQPVSISDATGYGFRFVNAGDIENKGVEVSLNLTPVRNRDFSWDLGLNWTRNRNVVKKLFADNLNLQLGRVQGGVSINATVGQPYGTIRGSDFVYYGDDPEQTEASAIGQHIIDPKTGDPLLTGTNEVIGDINPDWLGGINNTFRYKNLSLSFLIDIKQGGDVFSIDQWYGQGTGLYKETAGVNDKGNPIRESVSKGGGILHPGVTPDGQPNTTYATVSGARGLGYLGMPNKAFVFDASYVKLRNVSISYNFPQKWFENMNSIKSATLSLFGRNLWIIHKNLPYADPEDAASSGNIQGFQVGSYPTYRMYGFNLNVTF